jgi:hypothetical protein
MARKMRKRPKLSAKPSQQVQSFVARPPSGQSAHNWKAVTTDPEFVTRYTNEITKYLWLQQPRVMKTSPIF